MVMLTLAKVMIFVVLLFSVILHEVAHGYTALRLGDPTARDAGRLSLNPIKHVDPFGTVFLPLLLHLAQSPILIGWAKPVPVNPLLLREPKKATKLFQQALAQANKIGDTVGLGRTQIASGIAYQHLGDFESTKIMIDEGLKNLPQYHQDKLVGYAHNAAAAEKNRECSCGDLKKTILYAAKGILLHLGLKLDMFEVSSVTSENGYPSVKIDLIHRIIPEDKITKAESIAAYCRRELPNLIESYLGYNPV